MAHVSARAKRRRSYAEIPDLDPNDAGFLRDWGPAALGAGAARFQHHSGGHNSATLPPPGTAAHVAPLPPGKPVELEDEEGDEDAPDDVMAALALLRAQFPAAGRAAGMGPLMLKSQLYALVPDRTLVDRRIDELRESGHVRVFKLASAAADDYAYMLPPDYSKLVLAQRVAFEQRGTGAAQLAVFDAFLAHVVPAARDAGIGHVPLLRLLSRPMAPPTPPPAVIFLRTTSAPVPCDAVHSAPMGRPPDAALGARDGPAPTRKRPVMRLRSAPAALPPPSSLIAAPVARSASLRPPMPGRSGVQRPPSPAVTATADAPGDERPAYGGGAAGAVQSQPAKAGDVAPQILTVTDTHVTLLLNAGLLARHPLESHAYLFSVPTTGPLVRSIAKGRAELHGLVSRRRYGELPERELQGRKLQRSVLDVRFHIRDLVGMGMLERVQTTSGVILRAPKHKA